MSSSHMLQLPKAVWILKIVQLALAVLVIALSAYNVSIASNSASDLALFTGLFSVIILVYYFVAVHAANAIYNWIALLVLECLAVVFWLSTWADLAAILADVDGTLCYAFNCYSFSATLAHTPFWEVWFVDLAFSIIANILFVITLIFMALAVHKHRQAGKPMSATGTYTSKPPAMNGGQNEMQMHNMQQQPVQYGSPEVQHAQPGQFVQPQGQQYVQPQGQYAQPQGQYVQPQGQYAQPQGQYASYPGQQAGYQEQFVPAHHVAPNRSDSPVGWSRA